MARQERLTDADLAEMCDRNGFPSVRDRLAAGQTQEQATSYLMGREIGGDGFYDDSEGHWLKSYINEINRCVVDCSK